MVKDNFTLHLLTAAPRLWSALLPEIARAWQSGDQLLLLAEGAAGANAAELERFNAVAVYANDLDALNLSTAEIPKTLQVASAADWATWTLHYPRTITWR